MLNPDAPAFGLIRQIFGDGDPDEADPTRVQRAFSQDPQMAQVLGMLEAEITERQGGDAWPLYLRSTIARWSRWPGYGYAELARITVPVLIMVGDRDHFCSAEEAALGFRHIGAEELAVLPGTGHIITTTKVELMVDFLHRSAN